MAPHLAGLDETGGVVAGYEVEEVVGGYGTGGDVVIDVVDVGATVVVGYCGREDVGSCPGDVVTVALGEVDTGGVVGG